MKLRPLLTVATAVWLVAAPVAFGQQLSAAAKATDQRVDVASTPHSGSSAPSGFTDRTPRYQLRKGDSFDVDFSFSPEFNQTVTVQPDGFVTLKGATSVRVENQTVPEATETIKAAYAHILHEPAIAIVLKDFEKPFFIAGGQVTRPGKYELRSDTTLSEAVAVAGGFTDAAKHSQVVLFRRVSTNMVEARVFDLKHMLASRNLEEDPHLSPGDMLYVPQSTWSKLRRYLPNSSVGMFANPTPF